MALISMETILKPSHVLTFLLTFSLCCSATKSYQTLYRPMDCSTPGFPVLNYLPEFAQTHVHWVDDAIQQSALALVRHLPNCTLLLGCPLVAQLVKNPPAMWETWVLSLGWEDPLEKGKATHCIFWPGEFHQLYSPWGCKESDTANWLSLSFYFYLHRIWVSTG